MIWTKTRTLVKNKEGGGTVRYASEGSQSFVIIQFGPSQWGYWIVRNGQLENSGIGGSITSAKRICEEWFKDDSGEEKVCKCGNWTNNFTQEGESIPVCDDCKLNTLDFGEESIEKNCHPQVKDKT